MFYAYEIACIFDSKHLSRMETEKKLVQVIFFLVRCYYCKIACVVQCGHCCAALMYLGQKHNCPDPDNGFFDDNDFDSQIYSICDREMERFS